MGTREFDLVVIGSGPGGYKAALAAAQLGARVALIEQHQPGGTCLNQGCIPKKTLVYLATLIEDVNALNGSGLVGAIRGDFSAALAHKDRVVKEIRDNFPFWLRRAGVQLRFGEARLDAPHQVLITSAAGSERLTTHRVILATGAAPRPHPACPVDGERIITSREFMVGLRQRPESVLCVGGGTIGCELGFLLNQFGSHVTLVESAQRLLPRPSIPERASEILGRKFSRLGMELRLGQRVTATHVEDDGVRVTFSDGSQARYAQLLVAIGRQPRSADLGLEAVGVTLDSEGFVETNEYLETSIPGVYAIGDVTRGPMTANAALHGAKVAAVNAINGNQVKRNYHSVPVVIDSALEIAAVGLTEEQAEAAGFEPDVARTHFGASAKARGRRDTEGFIEVVHDEETGQLLGGCIVGPEAGEQIHMLSAACHSQRGLWFFTDLTYSHPSWCEELENAIDPYTAALTRSGKALFQPGIFAPIQTR